MARTLSVYLNSTPTYQYNVTDYLEAGINIEEYGIGMSIYDSETENSVHILPETIGTSVTFVENIFSEENVTVYRNNRYCRNLGEGKFSITIPRILSLVGEGSYSFCVFIFKYETLNPRQVINDTLVGANILYSMLVLDYGSFDMNNGYLPVLIDTKARIEDSKGVRTFGEYNTNEDPEPDPYVNII